MTDNATTYVAWIALALALIAWSGVGFFAHTIQAMQTARIAYVQQLQSNSTQASRVSSMEAVISDTATERASLDTIAAVDPASLADTITNAGASAGVTIGITDANSGSGPSISGVTPTQTFSFVASAAGNFASVMYATELLETLPVPSSIQQIQIIAAPKTSGASAAKPSWQMNAQVQVLTASTASL